MFVVQLYIQDNDGSDIRVDMFKDESVSITQTIQDVRDIGSVYTDFTRTFSLPASSTNNKIFKHYYNSDIVSRTNVLSSDFDARIRRSARIELNHTPYKKGKIRLDGVNMKDGKPYTYKITFFGETINLISLMGDDKLSSLDLSSFDTTYTATQLKSKLVNAVSDLIVPLITHTRRLVYDSGSTTYDGIVDNLANSGGGDNQGLLLTELKYALRVHKIIEAIQSKYNLTFSDDFFNTTNTAYYNLFMWLHRKSGDVGSGSQVSEPFVKQIKTFQTGTFSAGASYDSSIVSDGTTLTVEGDDNLNFEIEVVPSDNSITYKIDAFLDGVLEYSVTGTGTQTLEMIGLCSPSVVCEGDYTFNVSTTSSSPLSVSGTVTMTVEGGISLPETTYSLTFSSTSISANPSFNISSEIPEMKNIDFLTGIFKMFNLTAYVEDDGTIKIQTLDSFYNTGIDYDITDYIDINDSEINTALPYKEVDFRYQGRDSFFSITHEKIFGLEWGTDEYLTVDPDGSVYKVELPFEHHKFQKLLDLNDTSGDTSTVIQWGWSANENQEPYIGKPLLFYPIRVTSGETIYFRESTGSSGSNSSYIVPSNSIELNNTSQTIHFGTELNEYTNTVSTESLFKTYYNTYISDVFDAKNRLTRVTAFLPAEILLNFTLADRFIINQKSYKINSITTDLYNGKSEIELLNDFNA
jgi:hypothetical protein